MCSAMPGASPRSARRLAGSASLAAPGSLLRRLRPRRSLRRRRCRCRRRRRCRWGGPHQRRRIAGRSGISRCAMQRAEPRGAPRRRRRTAHFMVDRVEARSRDLDHQDHVRRRGAGAGPARIGAQARFHQVCSFTRKATISPRRRRSSGRRRRGPRGRGAPCRARDRAHRGQGLAQGRRGFSGALGRGRTGGRGVPRPLEKEPPRLMPDSLVIQGYRYALSTPGSRPKPSGALADPQIPRGDECLQKIPQEKLPSGGGPRP